MWVTRQGGVGDLGSIKAPYHVILYSMPLSVFDMETIIKKYFSLIF